MELLLRWHWPRRLTVVVELIFGAAGFIPEEREAKVVQATVTWNYTTFLHVLFLVLAAALVWRAPRTPAASRCCA